MQTQTSNESRSNNTDNVDQKIWRLNLSSKCSHLRGRLQEIQTADSKMTCVGRQKMKLGSKPLIWGEIWKKNLKSSKSILRMWWNNTRTIRMTATIDKNQWCGQFERCNGCKLQSECMVKPEEMFPVMEDGKYVDKWAIRTTAMIARELGKQNNKAAWWWPLFFGRK